MIKNFFVNNLPFLGKFKRYFVALKDSISPVQFGYSQHREDAYILKVLEGYNLEGSIYVDIGANHPTDISNTYLLYRKGLNGIIIEPNLELIRLFKLFRKRDIPLMLGCSNKNAVLPFSISKTPVISSFNNRDINLYKTVFLPVMLLDDAISYFHPEFISLLSIDVEGLNLEVMEGGENTITKSLIVCVEYDSLEEKDKIMMLLGNEFQFLIQLGCNLLFLNRPLSQIKIKSFNKN